MFLRTKSPGNESSREFSLRKFQKLEENVQKLSAHTFLITAVIMLPLYGE